MVNAPAQNPVNTPKIGRPGLDDSIIKSIAAALQPLEGNRPEFRRKRRELASEFDRTEGAIQKIYLAELAKKAQEPDRSLDPSDQHEAGQQSQLHDTQTSATPSESAA